MKTVIKTAHSRMPRFLVVLSIVVVSLGAVGVARANPVYEKTTTQPAAKESPKARALLCPAHKPKRGQVTETTIAHGPATVVYHEAISKSLSATLADRVMGMVYQAGEIDPFNPKPVTEAQVRTFARMVAADLKICME